MLQKISDILFDLQESSTHQTNYSFKKINLKNIDYMKNNIYSKKLFRIIEKKKEQEKIFIQLSNLLIQDKHLENWIKEMIEFYGNNFSTILKLNYINYKKTKRPFPA